MPDAPGQRAKRERYVRLAMAEPPGICLRIFPGFQRKDDPACAWYERMEDPI